MFVDFEILGLKGGTLAGVSSPHSAFSKVAGKSFSVFIWTKLGMPTGSPGRGPPTNFEENPTTKGPSAVKGKNVNQCWPNLHDICTYVSSFPENLKGI